MNNGLVIRFITLCKTKKFFLANCCIYAKPGRPLGIRLRDMITQTDKNGVAITKGAIVCYKDGTRKEYIGTIHNADGSFTPQYNIVDQYTTGRITRLTSEWANIGGVWGGKVFAKKVPLTELIECEAEWYDNWTKSDAYRCM